MTDRRAEIAYGIEPDLAADEMIDLLECSGLAVDAEWQGRGVGRALIRHTRGAAGGECNLVRLAAPGADGFYGRAGLARFDNAWGAPRER